MAKICNKKVGLITVMSVTFVLVTGGLFALMNSAVSDPGDTVAGATTMEAPIDGKSIGEAVPAKAENTACDFGKWVGQTVQAAETAAKATNRAYRLLPPGTPMTMDYRADRINIELDKKGDDGKVTRVFCG